MPNTQLKTYLPTERQKQMQRQTYTKQTTHIIHGEEGRRKETKVHLYKYNPRATTKKIKVYFISVINQ